MLHSIASLNARHPIHNWEYANVSARIAATGFDADDIGKVAFQTDTQTFWMLVDDSPVTWVPLSSGDISTVIATGELSSIRTNTCRTIVGQYAIEGIGTLAIEGTGRLHIST